MSLETNQNQNFHEKPEKRKQSNSKNSYNGYTEFSLREAHFSGTLHEHCLSSEKTQRTEGAGFFSVELPYFISIYGLISAKKAIVQNSKNSFSFGSRKCFYISQTTLSLSHQIWSGQNFRHMTGCCFSHGNYLLCFQFQFNFNVSLLIWRI